MFAKLRKKEIVLLALIIFFIPGFAFYNRAIAPKFGQGRIRALGRLISKANKKVAENNKTNESMISEVESTRNNIKANDERIARMRKEASEFKKFILSDRYEVDLYIYLFGRDARYSVIGLGNNPKRVLKGSYTEIIYQYKCKGKFSDIVKMVKKVENTSKSLSISSLEVEKPKIDEDDKKKDDGSVIAELKIHAIFSSLDNALSFDEFEKGEPDLEIRKIDGNPWDANFSGEKRQSEGPTGPVKKLFVESIFYLSEPGRRAVKFYENQNWYRIGDEFQIEAGKSFTTARVLAIGGRYVIVKHLNKNQDFKISLNVTQDAKEKEQTNYKEMVELFN